MPIWRTAIFILVLSTILVSLSLYVEKKIFTLFEAKPTAKKKIRIFWIIGILLWFISRFWGEVFPLGLGPIVGIISGSLGLFVIISALLLLIIDTLHLLYAFVKKIACFFTSLETSETDKRNAQENSEISAGMSRRGFLVKSAQGSALAVAAGSSAYGTIFGRRDYVIEEVPVPIEGLSPALDGYTITQISDIHFGTTIGERELKAATSLIRSTKPDLIVITGDIVDFNPSYATLAGKLVRELENVAKDGICVIPGNHDYYTGVEKVLHAIKKGGATVLRNQGKVLGDLNKGFSLLGVDDVWAKRMGDSRGPNVQRALEQVPSDLPRILLCHNPSYFPEAHQDVQLQLSGHTHGGQINLFVKPANFVLPYGYVEGMYKRDKSYLYVNRGFGTAGPAARIGAPPEITKIVLVSTST